MFFPAALHHFTFFPLRFHHRDNTVSYLYNASPNNFANGIRQLLRRMSIHVGQNACLHRGRIIWLLGEIEVKTTDVVAGAKHCRPPGVAAGDASVPATATLTHPFCKTHLLTLANEIAHEELVVSPAM